MIFSDIWVALFQDESGSGSGKISQKPQLVKQRSLSANIWIVKQARDEEEIRRSKWIKRRRLVRASQRNFPQILKSGFLNFES